MLLILVGCGPMSDRNYGHLGVFDIDRTIINDRVIEGQADKHSVAIEVAEKTVVIMPIWREGGSQVVCHFGGQGLIEDFQVVVPTSKRHLGSSFGGYGEPRYWVSASGGRENVTFPIVIEKGTTIEFLASVTPDDSLGAYRFLLRLGNGGSHVKVEILAKKSKQTRESKFKAW